ncbi:hypothetical protein Egran_05263 [Elaphomyces granulatus]|uniref:non-specific serine/threonine protein kinase n=1 Tax=Elaphomyces granulatus TaxID=519963 RepID=A0A232LS32_9EURO|nr:hypothetical protein Egran_05263 [Elaphomyces granulatus]
MHSVQPALILGQNTFSQWHLLTPPIPARRRKQDKMSASILSESFGGATKLEVKQMACLSSPVDVAHVIAKKTRPMVKTRNFLRPPNIDAQINHQNNALAIQTFKVAFPIQQLPAMGLKQTGFGSNCYKLGGGRAMSTSLLFTVFLGGNLSPGFSPLRVVASKSRWTVRLYECFQDAANIYLVMDHTVGGDFSSILREVHILPEDTTGFVLAEMILGVQEVPCLAGYIGLE